MITCANVHFAGSHLLTELVDIHGGRRIAAAPWAEEFEAPVKRGTQHGVRGGNVPLPCSQIPNTTGKVSPRTQRVTRKLVGWRASNTPVQLIV